MTLNAATIMNENQRKISEHYEQKRRLVENKPKVKGLRQTNVTKHELIRQLASL